MAHFAARAGLTVSDSEGTTLLVDQIWPYENSIDDIDRPAVLRMLFDATLDQSETDPDELIFVIKRALDAPNLRHGDVVSAASRLWQAVASETKSVGNCHAAATWVIEHWPPVAAVEVPVVTGQGGKSSSSAALRMLYLLEGLERYLRHTPSDFRLGIEFAAKIEEQRIRVAKWCARPPCGRRSKEDRGAVARCRRCRGLPEDGSRPYSALRKLAIGCVSVHMVANGKAIRASSNRNPHNGGRRPNGGELRLRFACGRVPPSA